MVLRMGTEGAASSSLCFLFGITTHSTPREGKGYREVETGEGDDAMPALRWPLAHPPFKDRMIGVPKAELKLLLSFPSVSCTVNCKSICTSYFWTKSCFEPRMRPLGAAAMDSPKSLASTLSGRPRGLAASTDPWPCRVSQSVIDLGKSGEM